MSAESLSDFLLARIAEDEEEANALMPGLRYDNQWRRWQRVLAECEAKRRIVGRCIELDVVPSYWLDCLALPYADHPDYLEEWKP